MMKRILSLLLAFLMVVSILPTPTHAEDTAGGPTAAVTEPACPTCGKSGCTSSHENWCRICLADNCGVDHSKKPAETQASADEAGAINEDEAPHPMVGKIVMLAGTVSYPEVIENPNISVYGSMVGVSAFPERMEIESVVTIGNVDYYQLKAAAGYTWPEYPVSINEYKCYEHHWLKSSQVALAEESEPECPVCGEPGCTAQHKQCEICGKYDCTKFHFWCDRCGKYDCGKSHLICPACGNVDCTKNHVFCGYCGTYDDCEGHDFAPAVEAELPENPVLTEGADVSIVDENGQPATSFRLTEGSKSSISAWSTLDDSSEAAYQWQICYDDENDLWTNIQGQTGKGLLASAAMFLPILEQKGAAAVRCVMTVDGETRTSDPIPVTIAGEQIEMATFARYASAAPAAYAAAPAAEDNENKVNLIINYVFTDGKIAANPRTATLPAGVAYAPATPVTVPNIPGYVPQLGESATDGAAALNGYDLTLSFTAEEMQSDRTVKIVYHPAPVKVVVHHYQQNVDNDNYTLMESEEMTLTTGQTVGNVHKTYEGFYNLLYEHPVVAADGSTVVDVYYDRYYYLMTFDLSGGYGIDAVYARYGTPIPENPGNAVRPGYMLIHWTLDGYTQPVYKTMPARNTTFVAVWAAQDTAKLTVMYWGENPNDDEYSIINTKELMVEPGSTLQYAPCDRTLHVHNAACYGINASSATLESHDMDMYKELGLESGYVYVTWEGNLKWAYLYLNGQWYSVNESIYDFNKSEGDITNRQVGTKILNARKCKANLTLQCTETEHTHGNGCCTCSTPYHSAEETCGLFISLEDKIWTFDHSDSVTVLPDGSSVLNVYFSRKEYTLRFYYAASVNKYSSYTKENITYRVVGGTTYYFGSLGNSTMDEVPLLDRYFVEGRDMRNQTGEVANKPTLKRADHGYTEGTTPGADGNTYYYYISFTAKYGANIYDMWPADVFNSVYCYNNDWDQSKYAFVSAWNGEHHVYYSQKNDNETIKGKYAVLDDNLLWDYNQFGAYAEVETDANGNEYNVIDFLCFWENGADVGWSYPSLFRYHIYVEPYEDMDITGLQSRTWNGKTYYFKEAYDTIDNSIQNNANIDEQTYPEIEGFTQLPDYYKKDSSTGKAIAETYEYQRMQSFDTNLYQRAYDIYFYYNRTEYQLQFFNETGVAKTEQVKFERPLASFASYTPSNPVDENGIPIYEAGSHRFAGWYDNPNFEGDPFDFDNTAMPAENIILYAKWEPVHRTVRFFLDKASMAEGKILPKKMAELYAAKNNGENDPNDPYTAKYATLTAVPHGSKITIPETPGVSEGYEDVHPYAGYDFIGWFYLNDEGEETAFDPANMPVTRNLDLYAKWSSNVLCPYEIRYILDENGNGELDADETTAVANPTTGSTLAGNSRTFDAKGDIALYADYQEGYFPNVASHTIDFKTSDEAGMVYTFLYKKNNSVPYRVYYVTDQQDKDNSLTSIELDGKTYYAVADAKVDDDNVKAVVTENFKPVDGYMPDKFQKTLVVVPGGKNEIIFHYTVDKIHAPYQVNYYIQNLDGSTWSLYSNADFTGDIDTHYSADAITITGFTYSVSETTEYNETQKINAYTGDTLPGAVTVSGSTVSGTLTDNGMQLNLYYTRNTHSYKVQYLEYGTNNPLADEKTVPGVYYNQNVTESAITIQKDMDGDGKYEDFQLYEPKDPSQSATITDNDKVFVFYYVRCTAESLSVTKVVEGNGADADQTFNFTLTSTATDFATVSNGSYAYKIKAGETVVDENYKHVDETSKAITFSLKAGQTITFAGLPTAVYTVAELTDDLPLGYYYKGIAPTQPVTLTKGAKETITVTNTYEPAQLEIKKIVNRVENVTDNVTDFKFEITVPDTATETYYSYTVGGTVQRADVENGIMTITLMDGETACFSNLPEGAYTVAEKDYTSEGYSAKYEDSDATNGTTTDGKVTLVRGQKDTVTCTNAYPVGSLTLTKIVNKAYEPDTWPLNMKTDQAQEFTFTFTIIRTDANLTVGNSYPVYRGTENIGTVTVENVPVNDETKPALVYQLKYSDFGSQTVKFDNLPKGSYTVLENEDTSGSFTQSDRSIDTSISPEDYAGTATFTNTYKKHKGDLKITKTVETVGGETAPADAVFTFKIGGTCVEVGKSYAYSIDDVRQTETIKPDGNNNLYVKLKAGQTAVIHDLNADAFTIYEETIPAGFLNTAETRTAADGNKIFANDPEKNLTDATHVYFTNTYVHRGDLKVTKYIDRGVYDNVEIDDEEVFAFTVQLNYQLNNAEKYIADIYGQADDENPVKSEELTLSAEKTLTFTLKHGQSIVIRNLPAVAYTITENRTEDQIEEYLAPNFHGKESGTIPAEVTCYNPIKMLSGNLTITKKIEDKTLNQYAPKDKAFTFNVTLRNVYGSPLEELTYDITYVFDTQKGSATEFETCWQYIPNGGTGTTMYKLPKQLTLTEGMDKEYHFSLNLCDGISATVVGLPASYGYVEETDYSADNFAASYDVKSGPIGGVTGDIDNLTVNCVNTYPANLNGVLKIKKQVTKDYERDVVPGDTFIFTVQPTDGNVLSGEYTVTIATDTPLAPATTESKVTAADNKLVVKISFTKEELSGLGLNDSRTKILSIENLPMGAYEIVENLDEDYRQEPANRTLVVNATANPQEAVFINRYKRHLGTLTIIKTGADPIDENQSFVFTVTSGSISIPVVLNSENKFKATLSELPFGTYTITEDSSWSWRYTLAANQRGSAEINGQNPDVTVEIANVRTETKWLNGAAFESNWFTAKTE